MILLCKGEDELRAAIDRRPPSACSYFVFDFGEYQHRQPKSTVLAESDNYWDLVQFAQQHEKETGHITAIEE